MDLITDITPDILLNKTVSVIDALKNEEVWRAIPLVSSLDNFDQLKEMQLVRFRGLVQDMMDPEIYLEIFQTKSSSNELKTHNGKYRENIKLQVMVDIQELSPSIELTRQKIFSFVSRKTRNCCSIPT